MISVEAKHVIQIILGEATALTLWFSIGCNVLQTIFVLIYQLINALFVNEIQIDILKSQENMTLYYCGLKLLSQKK